MAASAACFAEGVQTCTEFWNPAPQQQALDSGTTPAVQVRSESHPGMDEKTTSNGLRMLRWNNEDYRDEDSFGIPLRRFGSNLKWRCDI